MSSRGELEVGEHLDASTCGELAKLFASRPGPNPERLASVIFDDIVPRLHMLHHELSAKDAERAFSCAEISEFGAILIKDDMTAADRFLDKMRACGRSEEALYLGLMAETARHLGALWEEDLCSFVDVTIGVARLQKMLCAFSGVCESTFAEGHRVLLCALAGESHIFGLDMVACFMRQACWDVDLQKGVEAHDVADAVAGEWFAVLGFSLSAEAGLETLCRAIQSGRAASVNPAIAVLVGGPLFRAQPNLVAQVGADAMASDAASASLLARRLLLRQPTKHARHHSRPAAHNAAARPRDDGQPPA
ncbi:cobalamin B12-binding domain-containing protein [Methylocystis echinoides]|jgi:methanogenic corrinoid protein MtbC1|uniref:cobalamin B12-binding domain-containing protein n=1 Tax=Methylocystis echinoides TaxID=29468 RepID=UPI0034358BC2